MGVEDIANGGINVVRALIPPRTDSPAQNRWSWAVTLSLYAVMLGGSIHVAWVCGWLSIFGISAPYALASDVSDYKASAIQSQMTVRQIQQGQLQDKITDAKTHVCVAIAAKNQAALDAWARQLEQLKSAYRDNIHQEPAVMGCDELLIGGTQG